MSATGPRLINLVHFQGDTPVADEDLDESSDTQHPSWVCQASSGPGIITSRERGGRCQECHTHNYGGVSVARPPTIRHSLQGFLGHTRDKATSQDGTRQSMSFTQLYVR